MSVEDDYGLVSRDTLQRTADAIRYAYDIDDRIYPAQFPDYINPLNIVKLNALFDFDTLSHANYQLPDSSFNEVTHFESLNFIVEEVNQ